jgi:tetratricopeptide (TPR) repeat protein
MKRFAARYFLLIFPSLFASHAFAQAPAPHVEETSSGAVTNALPAAPAAQRLFGRIALSTSSEEARKLVELAWDKYENAMYDDAVRQARRATEKDPQSTLAYAMVSFAARRGMPDIPALAKAKSLLLHATSDEQLLVRWMTSIQDREILPAIMNMNDLLKRFPKDKHILYLAGEWLFLQQDYDRARSLMETALQLDPNFPAVLNRLGYVYVQTGDPDPTRAVASLKRYAQAEPNSPNPQDSLGEVLRIAGDDSGSLEHYSAALQIDPTYFASQTGLGDTRTLMGDFAGARKEYDRAIRMATNPRDELYVKYQKALVYFWEGQPEEGRKGLAALAGEAVSKKEPNAQFDIGLASAMLAADPQAELAQLRALAVFLEKPLTGMLESDRGLDRASVLREIVRVASSQALGAEADDAVARLADLALSSRDQVIVSAFESARGYVLFQQGDFAQAASELSADSHSQLALHQLAVVQEKLGNASAAQSVRAHLRFRREPTVEWFLVQPQKNSASR